MAKKKIVQQEIETLRKVLKEKQVIFGTHRSMDMAKNGKVKQVFTSSNCPDDVKEDLVHYSKISGFEIVELPVKNDELGTICKKPFSISVLCELKE